MLSNVIASQFHLHAQYGGVVPEVASRHHLEVILQVIDAALAEAGVTWGDLAGVAVTAGPGLAGALLVGVNTAKTLAYAHDLPLLGVNHLEAHLYANWLDADWKPEAGSEKREARTEKREAGGGKREDAADPASSVQRPVSERADSAAYQAPPLPALGLIVSGGHTDLVLMRDHGDYQRLGRTRDDAAGEAFDKVGRLLGLGFPGGPAIERTAREAPNPSLRLPRAWLKGTDDFSFSGLKTAVLHMLRDEGSAQTAASIRDDGAATGSATPGKFAAPPPRRRPEPAATLPGIMPAEIASAFQASVIDVLTKKAAAAAAREGVRSVLLSGGVAANRALKDALIARSPVPVFTPPPVLCTDNGAMIAACAYYRFDALRAGWALNPDPAMRFAVAP